MSSSAVDMVGYWMQQAGRYPLLTPAQEISLGKQVQDWLSCPNPDARTIKRGQRAREKMIKSNLRLSVAICNKHRKRIERNCAVSMDDLLQESILGLSRACEKFDPTAGYKFSTYAYWWVRQSVSRYVEITQSAIKPSTQASQIAMRWRYREAGTTLEQFAEQENRPIEKVRDYLECFERCTLSSLDADRKGKGDEEGSALIDMIASNDSDVEESDWIEAVQDLNQIDEIKDAMALVELSLQTRKVEMAEFLECSTYIAKQKLNDAKSVIREHAPSHIRERVVGTEQKECVKMEPVIPLPEPSPAKELALVSCCSDSSLSMPDAITQPSANGHSKSLESEAMEVIAAVQSEEPAVEPEPKAKATRRGRRSTEEIQAERAAKAVSLTINGSTYEGSPAAIAAVVAALNAA